MNDDYRNTKYCPKLTNLADKKNGVKNAIITEHPRVKDMHTYISKNDDKFKQQFITAYNGKCAYCGVSLEIIPWKMFEIDHFIPKESKRFGNSKAKAGFIENLVLSCYDCNRAKSNIEYSDEDVDKIHPDGSDILNSFVRDNEYYIRISEAMRGNDTVNLFYKQVDLCNQIHRIDYLLMNMRGLCGKITDKHPAYSKLMEAIQLLQNKRNIMR